MTGPLPAPRAAGGEHIPDAVPRDDGVGDGDPRPLGGGEEEVGIGLGEGTSSRVTTGTDGGTPSLARLGAAVARVPLVAIAQRTPRWERSRSNATAPGSGHACGASSRKPLGAGMIT
jgi:hypothetical protein